MAKKDSSPAINNFAIIQYLTKKGEMKILAFSSYDVKYLKNRVTMHIGTKQILSIQFYYNVTTNGDLHILKEGVILE